MVPESNESAAEDDRPPNVPRQDFTFDGWVETTMAASLAYAKSLLGDAATAEDIVQDCYFRIYKRADNYDLRRDGVAILRRAITNACINHRVRQRPSISFDAIDRGNPSNVNEVTHWDIADKSAPDPSQSAISSELRDLVEVGLGTLPVRQRAALELRSLGHSITEIADILDMTTNSVNVVIHRARQSMAHFLSLHWNERK